MLFDYVRQLAEKPFNRSMTVESYNVVGHFVDHANGKDRGMVGCQLSSCADLASGGFLGRPILEKAAVLFPWHIEECESPALKSGRASLARELNTNGPYSPLNAASELNRRPYRLWLWKLLTASSGQTDHSRTL